MSRRLPKAQTTTGLVIRCPFCSLSVELPAARWVAEVDSCPRCGLDADLRPDPHIAAEQLRLAAVMLEIKAQTLTSVAVSLLSSRERWVVWDAARRVRSIVEDLEAP